MAKPARPTKPYGLNIRLPEKLSPDKPGKVSEEELLVRILAKKFVTYLAMAPDGNYGEKPQGSLKRFILERIDGYDKEYGGRFICYLGKALENLLNEGIISFHKGECFGAYVLEDLASVEEERAVCRWKNEG